MPQRGRCPVAELGQSPQGLDGDRKQYPGNGVIETFARLKMKVDDLSGSRLKLLESVEAVAVGIHGKGALWRVVRVVPAAGGPDYDMLLARAGDQRERIEAVRVNAVKTALAT